ncbi:hypothetical protein [Gimesia maris]|uniref:DUF3311 domain-containing protein n=1 Tax=Gimesia maris TaxID=122 RepID=A0ABX5YHC4_9PLAN|nr:hypothetical protein [Gimesia maris]QEG15080.1 hypothetical protein GmarT_09180 [Gimesia maris]QGQ31567.1 hypothetical protein F1729_24640 [Gimesia maris]
MKMNKKRSFLTSMLVFPASYLVVLLIFDLKHYDPNKKAYTVPIYPWPTYLKFVLSIVSFIITAVLLARIFSEPKKVNQSGSDSLIQENEVE